MRRDGEEEWLFFFNGCAVRLLLRRSQPKGSGRIAEQTEEIEGRGEPALPAPEEIRL